MRNSALMEEAWEELIEASSRADSCTYWEVPNRPLLNDKGIIPSHILRGKWIDHF